MFQMDWIIVFVLKIAMSVSRLTVYGSVNDVSVAILLLIHLKMQRSRSFISEGMVSFVDMAEKLFEFVSHVTIS